MAVVSSGRGSGSGSSSATMIIATTAVSALPEVILPYLPSIVTALQLVLSSPKVRVRLLVDGDPETIDPSPLAAPGRSPAIAVSTPLVLVSSGCGSGSVW